MKRLFKTSTDASQGGVWCNPDTQPFEDCCTPLPLQIIAGISCPDFDPVDPPNKTGALPMSYGLDEEIDTGEGFIEDFKDVVSYIKANTIQRSYPNLWDVIDQASGGFLGDVIDIENCFCSPDLDVNGNIGPNVHGGLTPSMTCPPLPFFWVPPVEIPEEIIPPPATGISSVRGSNPNGDPVAGDCCDKFECPNIEATIVDGELRMTYHPPPTPTQTFHIGKQSTDTSFTTSNGFPRWCCAATSSGDYEQVYLSFTTYHPRLDEDTDSSLCCIPVVIDIQCSDVTTGGDPGEGNLYVYYANLVFYEGILAHVQWNAEAPRKDGNPGASTAPIKPGQLPLNENYQGEPLMAGYPSSASDMSCEEAVEKVFGLTKCSDGQCPSCPGSSPDSTYTGNGSTRAIAISNAFGKADTNNTSNDITCLCWVNQTGNSGSSKWTAKVITCFGA